MFTGGTNVNMACDCVLHLEHSNAFSAIVVVWAWKVLAWVAVAVLFSKSRDVTSEFGLDVESFGTVLAGWRTVSVPSCISVSPVPDLSCWH